MSSVSIRPATQAEAPAIARVHYDAMLEFHDFYAAFFNIHPRDSMPKATALALKSPTMKFLVAVEGPGEGEVVGFMRYKMVTPEGEGEAKVKDEEKEARMKELGRLLAPKEHMAEMWDTFNEREEEMEAVYDKTMKSQKHAHIDHVMVTPDHQRKGIGRALVSRVLAETDAEGIPTMISAASPESYSLYGKLGFEDLGKWTMDNGYWAKEVSRHERELGMEGSRNEGLEEQYEGKTETEWLMVRWPKKVEE